ncbi:MAG: tetratricopeptide repeat protein [Bradyrhizobium sp.]|uniref:J domain-containing protein n=1 Tax=Bradyrhizobium sp. TaxID=376 RepID=UPI001D47BDB0|nr:tetratricopeptide repeat protein [Bradyrhizobium sp.]MBV9562940.1 tetratricopeptide repeat protein [Bradyrhizobium sp.]
MHSKFNAPSPVGRAGWPVGAASARTLYDVLGIDPRADREAIKRAFRAKVKKHHPDLRGGDPAASDWAALIIFANEVLRNPERRAAYDGHLARLRAPLLRARRQRMMLYAASATLCFALALVSAWKFGGLLTMTPAEHLAAAAPEQVTIEVVAREPVRPSERDVMRDLQFALVALAAREADSAPPSASERASQRVEAGPKPELPVVITGSVPAALPINIPFQSVGGDLDKIIATLDRLILRAPDDVRAYRLRGKAWARKGDLDRALADFDQAVRIKPNDPAVFHDSGLIWQRKGEFDKAIVDFDRAVRMSFSDPELYADRGAAWFEKGSYDRAFADFERAIEINPNLAAARVGRAAVFARRGDQARARADRERVVHPEHDTAQANAAPAADRNH